jgi:putative heme-binding domain-containing protein
LVDASKAPPDEAPIEQVRRLALLGNKEINDIVRKHWGNIAPGTPEEKLATMRRFNNDLRPGGGDPRRGKELFTKTCAVCHQLFGEGNKIGPDLTTANRQDAAALLGNIVDPSAVIRREYMNYVVETDSGQTRSGLIAEQDAAAVTLLDAQNHRLKIPREAVVDFREADVSLMPERLLDPLTPQELRDLFSYLQENPAK